MLDTPVLTARLRALVDELDAHVQGTPTATLSSIAADLDDLSDDVEAFERLHLLLPAAPTAREA